MSDTNLEYDDCGFCYKTDSLLEKVEKENQALKEKLRIAKEALEFYADKKTWGLSGSLSGMRSFMQLQNWGEPMKDFDTFMEPNINGYDHEPELLEYKIAGKRARQALKEIDDNPNNK